MSTLPPSLKRVPFKPGASGSLRPGREATFEARRGGGGSSSRTAVTDGVLVEPVSLLEAHDETVEEREERLGLL